MTPEEKLDAAGRAALAAAIRLWQSDIIDPSAADIAAGHARALRDRAAIDAILTACGWTWCVPYAGNHRGPEWCGLTAGACWREAGLDPGILRTWFASTYRLFVWANYRAFDDKHQNRKPAEGPFRVAVKLTGAVDIDARPGDILIVGDGSPEVGDHITIVEGYANGVFSTISGNGGGQGPDGKHREGVVRRDFPLAGTGYRAMWLYRPAPGDLL